MENIIIHDAFSFTHALSRHNQLAAYLYVVCVCVCVCAYVCMCVCAELTQYLSLVHVVCGEHHGAVVTVTQQKVPDLSPCKRVHPRGRLVKDNCLGFPHEGQEDGELSLHPSREVHGHLVGVGREPNLCQPAVGVVCVCFLCVFISAIVQLYIVLVCVN